MKVIFALLGLMAVGQAVAQPSPLNLGEVYTPAMPVSFTLPKGVFIEKGVVKTILSPQAQARKKKFIQALGAVDEALDITPNMLPKGANTPAIEAIPEGEIAHTPQAEKVHILNKEIAKTAYFPMKEAIMGKITAAKKESEKNKYRLDLARLNLIHQRLIEAEGVLANLPKDAQGIPLYDQARLLQGIVYTLQGRPTKAQPIWDTPTPLTRHTTLWQAVGLSQRGKYDRALEKFTETTSLFDIYPLWIDAVLTTAYGKVLLNYPAKANSIIVLARKWSKRHPSTPLPPSLNYILAHAYEQLGQEEKFISLLAEVAESGESKDAFQAKYEFIMALQEREELDNAHTADALENLRRIWRGDNLEEKILLDLGRIYLSEQDYRQALSRLKDYARYYANGEHADQVAYLMTRNFLSSLSDKNALLIDDLGYLSLFYDFRELTPADKRGDTLLRDVGRRLERLNLFNKARDVFSQQYEFRAETVADKNAALIDLARVHYKDSHIPGVFKALLKVDKTALTPKENTEYAVLLSKAYYAEEKYQEAADILKPIKTDEARDFLIDIAWLNNNNDQIIQLIAPIFQSGEHAGFAKDSVRNQFVKLAYAYARKADLPAIQQLKKRYPSALENYPEIEDAVQFALAKGGAEDLLTNQARPVSKLAGELSGINSLMHIYEKIQKDVIRRKIARESYNKKMKFIEIYQ